MKVCLSWRCCCSSLPPLARRGLQSRRAASTRKPRRPSARATQSGLISLYSQSVALDPYNVEYWLRSQFLRPQATLQAGVGRAAAAPAQSSETATAPAGPAASAQPPPGTRRPAAASSCGHRRSAGIWISARRQDPLHQGCATPTGWTAVFDADYPAGTAFNFRLAGADYRDALRALEAATASFVVPVAERRILVVKDTPQKRTELEPVVSVSIPIPTAITPQQVQEVMRGRAAGDGADTGGRGFSAWRDHRAGPSGQGPSRPSNSSSSCCVTAPWSLSRWSSWSPPVVHPPPTARLCRPCCRCWTSADPGIHSPQSPRAS